jgi:glycosyltransferase involved in cell wall biosynthesis
MKLSIIIPVFNEQKTVKDLISAVKKQKLPQGLEKEIIVVDDGSTDKTRELLKKLKGIKLYVHKINKGKGSAAKSGFENAKGDIYLIQDADLEYDPKYYPKLLKPILQGKANVVYGSRLKDYPLRIAGSKRTPLISHYLGNKFLTFLTNLLYGESVTDMETCYKVFKKEVVKDMEINARRFDLEPEITAKILKRGYKIHEVPIKVKPRGYDEGKKISWKDGFVAVWTLLKYKFID